MLPNNSFQVKFDSELKARKLVTFDGRTMQGGGQKLHVSRVKRVCTTQEIFDLIREKLVVQEDIALRNKMREKPRRQKVNVTSSAHSSSSRAYPPDKMKPATSLNLPSQVEPPAARTPTRTTILLLHSLPS